MEEKIPRLNESMSSTKDKMTNDYEKTSSTKKFRGENVEKELIVEYSIDNGEQPLKRKGISSDDIGSKQLDDLYASNLPTSQFYERSFMHRDIVTHLIVTKTSFLISGSQDGHIKFWKILTSDYLKQQQTSVQTSKYVDQQDKQSNLIVGPIEFVKHFRAHLGSLSFILRLFFTFQWILFIVFEGPILNLCVNQSGTLLCSTCSDRTLKLFDVLGFDMITMVKLDFIPSCSSFVHSSRDPLSTLAIGDEQSNKIYLFDSKNFNIRQPLFVLDRLGHRSNVKYLLYSSNMDLVISIDQQSMINYWNPTNPNEIPSNIQFQSKLDTDLFELMKKHYLVTAAELSPTGSHFALLAKSSTEKKLFLFETLKGKIWKIFNEHIDVYKDLHEKLQNKDKSELEDESNEIDQHEKQKKKSMNFLNNVEYSRRLTIEKDLDKNDVYLSMNNIQFDSSGTFLFYSTLYGIKMLNLRTNSIRQFFGTTENARFTRLALYQSNSTSEATIHSTILFANAFKKKSFLFVYKN